MSSWFRRAWLLAVASLAACSGESSSPSAPADGAGSELPTELPLIAGAIELWPGGPQLRNTASSRALRDRFRLDSPKAAGHSVGRTPGLAFSIANAVQLDVLGEGTTQFDGVFVTDISAAGVAVGRVGPRAAVWAPGLVSPNFLPSRADWGDHLSRAFHINSRGDIVGMVVSTAERPGYTDAARVLIVRWAADGSIIDLPTPVADSFQYAAPFITDAGDVYATISTTHLGPYQIARWHHDAPEIVATPENLPDASLIAVSRSGYLLATNPFQLFQVRRPDGSWIALQTPGSSSGIGVRALTEDGGALGLAVEPDRTQHGARWSPDGSAIVDALPEGLTRFSYLAQNGKSRWAGEGCDESGCAFYVLDDGDVTALPQPGFPGGVGSFQYANFGGLSDTDVAVGWYIDATLQIFSGVRWTLSFAPPENFPPVAHAGTAYAAAEGNPIQFTGTAADATPTGTLTSSWSFSDGGSATGLMPAHTFADDGSFTAALTVSDGQFAVNDTASVMVSNAAPEVHTGSGSTFVAGTTHIIQATFSDPGSLDAPWSYVVNWGDGSKVSSGTRASAGALDASHVYRQAGVFRIRITVTDKDGGVGTGEYTVTVGRKGSR